MPVLPPITMICRWSCGGGDEDDDAGSALDDDGDDLEFVLIVLVEGSFTNKK
jgi:hypothetical protein